MAQVSDKKSKLPRESELLAKQLVIDLTNAIAKIDPSRKDFIIESLLSTIKNFHQSDKEYAEYVLQELKKSVDNKKLKSFDFLTV